MALGVLAGHLPGQAIVARAAVAAKLFVGVQTDHQQAVDFVGLKGLAPFESVMDPKAGPAQLLRVQALADIAKGVVTDRMPAARPLLPLGHFGFLL